GEAVFGHGGSNRVEVASDMALDAMVEEDPGYCRVGLALGELELRILKLDNCLAEGLALLDIVDRERECPLHHRDGMHGDDQSLLRQFLHQLVEALPFFRAEQAGRRQLNILKEQF